MHPGARAEPVLRAWGISSDGKPVFLALEAANAESHDACAGFLRGLVGRGLRPPLLVTCDGAPGLIGAIEQVFDRSLRQRCLVHRACVDSTWWFGIGRRVVLRGDGGEKVCRAVKPRRRWREAKAVLFKQRADLRQGVTDRPAADVEQVGEGLHSAHLPQVEDGGQDPFGVGDLLPEDAPRVPGSRAPPRRWWRRRSTRAACRIDSPSTSRSRSTRGMPVRAGLDSCSYLPDRARSVATVPVRA
jgi:hypothetical protein